MAETVSAELEHLQEIKNQNDLVTRSYFAYDEAKNLAAAKKKKFEAEQERLRTLINNPDDCDRPLFEGVECKNSKDDWRKFDIHTLQEYGADEKQVEKLVASGIDVCQQLQEKMTAGKVHWFKSVAGIGRAAATKIEDAFHLLLVEHQDPVRPAEPETDSKKDAKKDPEPNAGKKVTKKKAVKKKPAKKAAKKTTPKKSPSQKRAAKKKAANQKKAAKPTAAEKKAAAKRPFRALKKKAFNQ